VPRLDPFALAERLLPDGRLLTVNPLAFGQARLNVSSPRAIGLSYDDGW
jgi:hypothetical protein